MPNDSLRKLFEKRFANTIYVYGAVFPEHVRDELISFLTEQVALAVKEKHDIVEKKLEPTDWLRNVFGLDDDDCLSAGRVAEMLESYHYDVLKILSPAPIIPEGEKLV